MAPLGRGCYEPGAMADVRVRFAPSPTGYLHIGGARTALYNWLWARKHGGTFVLRLEDTDARRSTPESVEAILESMRWLGLDWDEGPQAGGPHGPYRQSERLAIYREHAERLVEKGRAYRCYCTKDELEAARRAFEASGQKGAFRYPGTCRHRTDQPDRPFVVRLKAPEAGRVGWDDLVRGRVDYPAEELQDVVLLRADGTPLYNLGCVVDDLTMGITLVARGDDHLINTPIQLLLYEALGAEAPQFAHLPMILAPSGEKLSKRHAAVSVLEYRDMGYLPDGVLNYLARIGWSYGDQEIFGRRELIDKFDWSGVGRASGRYDAKKFRHVNAQHLRRTEARELLERAAPFFEEAGLRVDPDDPALQKMAELLKPRAETLRDLVEGADYVLREPPRMDEAAVRKFLKPDRAGLLRDLATMIRDVEPFEADPLEERVRGWVEGEGLSLGKVAQPARVALTGRSRSPGLFEVMEVLGRERTLARLEAGARRCERGEA